MAGWNCLARGRSPAPMPNDPRSTQKKGAGGMALQSYQELEVWRKGMDLAVECYSLTRMFPRDKLFGLTSQIRRAAASIPANIAEGQGRQRITIRSGWWVVGGG